MKEKKEQKVKKNKKTIGTFETIHYNQEINIQFLPFLDCNIVSYMSCEKVGHGVLWYKDPLLSVLNTVPISPYSLTPRKITETNNENKC